MGTEEGGMFEFDNLPGDLAALSAEELRGYEAAAVAELSALMEGGSLSDETLTRAEALAAGLDTIRAALAAQPVAAAVEPEPAPEPAQPAQEPAARLAALQARVTPAQPAPAPVAPPAQPAAAVTPAPAMAPAPAQAPAAVTASGSAADHQPASVQVPEARGPVMVITAAADIPSVSAGSNLDLPGLAHAIHMKARTLSDHSGNVPVATIEKQFDSGYDLSNLGQSEQFDAIMDMSGAQSLTASGGWCAPSEIIYDFFDLECARGSVLQLPTFKANRGGVRWPVSTPLPSAATVIDWIHTEANDIAGNTKPCITIPCPTFTECRLSAHGVCVTAGNLMDRAYPENIRRYLNQVFIAHERNENLFKLALLVGGSNTLIMGGTFAAASAVLSAIMLQVADYRDKYRMCDGAMLEAVFPIWIRDVIRADIARQEGTLNGQGALPTNADIDSWFKAMGVTTQFVNDWQPIGTESVPGMPAPQWPSLVSFLLYAPGTWLQFDGGTLDLGVVRDSVLNSTNDFTAAWTEEFYCIGLRGYGSRYITLPICPSGAVGARADEQCEGQLES